VGTHFKATLRSKLVVGTHAGTRLASASILTLEVTGTVQALEVALTPAEVVFTHSIALTAVDTVSLDLNLRRVEVHYALEVLKHIVFGLFLFLVKQ